MERCRARFGKTFTLDLLGIDPFVMMSRPEDIKAIFTAPPEVLHPGEGSTVLLPVVGPNSILLLDEERHMTQRKLMLPAFHGEKMEALRGVVTEVAEAEVDGWTTGSSGAAPPLHAEADPGGDPPRGLRPRSRRAPRTAARPAQRDAQVRDEPGQPDPRSSSARADCIRRWRTSSRSEREADAADPGADRRTPCRERGRATTSSRCCSWPVTRTARRCRTRSSATS